jgi:hypothetical protein
MMTTDPEDVPDSRAVLSALLDREAVDPDELARVLEAPEARALLVDFVRLRRELAIDLDDGVHALAIGVTPVARTSQGARWLRPLAAALLLTAAGAGGMWLGEQRREDRPPQPSRVVSFTPGVDWKEKP